MPPVVPCYRTGYQRKKAPLSAPASLVLRIGFRLRTIPTPDCFTWWLSRAAAFISRNRSRLLQARLTTALGLSFPAGNTHRKSYWHSQFRTGKKLGGTLRRVGAIRGEERSQRQVDWCFLQMTPIPWKQWTRRPAMLFGTSTLANHSVHLR